MKKTIKDLIRQDIERCEKQTNAKGSQTLYNDLIARYTLIFDNFTDGIPKNGKIAGLGTPFDYCPEIKAIKSKLETYLLLDMDDNNQKTNNKIFISHSHDDIDFIRQLEVYLRGLGIKPDDIFCSSIEGQGIRNGKKIETEVRKAINESKLLLFVISKNFINSPYCMQELGAGWILKSRNEVETFIIKLDDINPNDIQGFVNSNFKYTELNSSSLDGFGDDIRELFGLELVKATENTKLKEALLSTIKKIPTMPNQTPIIKTTISKQELTKNSQANETTKGENDSIINFSKLELLLFSYLCDNDKITLYAGWQINDEVKLLKSWCEINGLDDKLWKNYENVLNKFIMRKIVQIKEVTNYGNPKEYVLTDKYMKIMDELNSEQIKILEDNKQNFVQYENELPF